MKKENYC